MRLKKFAGRWGRYNFPMQKSGKDNFGDLVTNTVRLPGVSGGRDELNSRPAPQAIGTVDVSYDLNTAYGTSMRQQRDDLAAMAGWGKQRLFIDTYTDNRQGQRWVWARPTNIRMSENVKDLPHQQQKVQVTFNVDDPGWHGGQKAIYTDEGHSMDDGWRMEGAIYMDEGLTMDSGLYMNAVKLDVQATSGSSYPLYNGGTRNAKAVVRVAAREQAWNICRAVRFGDGHYLDGAVSAVGSITIELTANGQRVAAWLWGDTLQPGEELVVDSEKQSVYVNGLTGRRDAYSAFQRLPGGGYGFIEVPPGEHTITIRAGHGPRGCQLTVDFEDNFYSS